MKNSRNLTLSLLCVLLLASFGCQAESVQDQDDKTFNKKGVTFQHPANWRIGTDENFGESRLLIVNAPNNALVTIQINGSEGAESLETYAKDYSRIAAQEVRSGGKLSDEKMGKQKKDPRGFELIEEAFTVEVTGHKVPHDRKFYRKEFGKHVCFFVCQSSKENLAKVEKGFGQILSTFKLD